MSVLKIAVLDRMSYVAPNTRSRSLYERVLEPLSLLPSQISFELLNERDFSSTLHHSFHILFLSRHRSEVALRACQIAKSSGLKIVYDLDDLVTEFPDNNITGWSPEHTTNFQQIIEISDHIIVANANLKDRFPLPVQKKTSVIPTGIRIKDHPVKTGGSTATKAVFVNGDNLKFQSFKPDFFKVVNDLSRNMGLKLSVYADNESELIGEFPYTSMGSVPWETFRHQLSLEKFGCALVPLGGREDAKEYSFNICKSPVKYLLYGSLGIPAIYSDNEIYRSIVRDRETGVISSNKYSDWYEKTSELITNSTLRMTIINNSFEDIKANYSLSLMADRVSRVLSSL